MSLPDVCLAPHEAGELATSEPFCAPATHRVFVGHVLRGGIYLLRRVTLNNGQTEYVARRQLSPNSPLLRFGDYNGYDARRATEALRKGEIWRTIYVDKNGCLASSSLWHLALCVNAEGEVYWQSPGGVEKGTGGFRWNGKRRLSSLRRAWITDVQIEGAIRNMLSHDNSDCSFAWRWMQLDNRERFASLCRSSRGTIEECEKLLACVLCSDLAWTDNLPWIWNIDIYVESPPALATVYASTIDIGNYTRRVDSSPRQARLLEIIIAYFELCRKSEIEHKTVVQKAWGGSYTSRYYRTIAVPIPTHHERLEARLQLREWLQGKVAPEEIPFLLGENPG